MGTSSSAATGERSADVTRPAAGTRGSGDPSRGGETRTLTQTPTTARRAAGGAQTGGRPVPGRRAPVQRRIVRGDVTEPPERLPVADRAVADDERRSRPREATRIRADAAGRPTGR